MSSLGRELGRLVAATEHTPAWTGVHVGTITRTSSDGAAAWVEVATLAPGHEFGPAAVPSDWAAAPAAPGTRVAVLLSPAGHVLVARY